MSERLQKNGKWYDIPGENADIAISTRVRLARNLNDLPFPGRLSEAKRIELVGRIRGVFEQNRALQSEFSVLAPSDYGGMRQLALVERHLISPEFASSNATRALILSQREDVSVMVCEEDHLRIQSLGAGMCVAECYESAQRLDALIDETCPYAFDETLGYLTHCPTNLGTGMRVSVMLHLPALTETGRIQNVIAAAAKFGLAVRGLYGEGSSAAGGIYQISNQITLGLHEKEIIERLADAVKGIINEERSLRAALLERLGLGLADRVARAEAVLKSALLIGGEEAMGLIGIVRMGRTLKLCDGPSYERLNTLIWEIQPACLMERAGQRLDAAGRDKLRADILREAMATKDI